MGLLTPFIVLIERRLLRPVWLALLATMVLVTGLGAHAGKPGLARKMARDLEVAVNAPIEPNERWSRRTNGRRMVDAIVVSNSPDRSMAALRAHVLRLGGTVSGGFTSVQALSVTVPTSALAELDDRDDVVSISPNRTTRHTFSGLELTAGVATPAVRTATGTTTYTGLDGKGIGIAVLDSGVMAGHRHMDGPLLGFSRVVAQVNMVGQGANLGYASSLAPGSLERNLYETQVKTNILAVADAYGHGTHVAAIAAGKGTYRTLDTTGIAPGASIIDVKVLNADGTGNVGDVIAGLDWVLYNAKKHNIRIVNLSLAAGSTSSWVNDPLAQAARAVVASGIVVVTASGNYGQVNGKTTFGTVGSPGHDPSVITVGSSNMKLTAASRTDDVVNGFSSRGPTRGATRLSNGQRVVDNLLKPDLLAPGNAMISAAATSSLGQWNKLAASNSSLLIGLTGQVMNQTLMFLSGTSVSAPVVSGAVALMLQANPGLTPPLVKASLQYSAQPLAGASLVEQGAGMLNIDGAVRMARAMRTDIASC